VRSAFYTFQTIWPADYNSGITVYHLGTEDFKSPNTMELAAGLKLRANNTSTDKIQLLASWTALMHNCNNIIYAQ
jgi:hypothetical protein